MRYRIFGERAGLKVLEPALGTGTFGQTWGHGAPPEDVKQILAAYADAGGNFIDTADNCQLGGSETLVVVPNWDDVIASKFVPRRCCRPFHSLTF
jgi:aryl-alcohol dehydrogenase-like predicted oxidoreductase